MMTTSDFSATSLPDLQTTPPPLTSSDAIGGTTLRFELSKAHPHAAEVYGLLGETRGRVNELWDRVKEYNEQHPIDEGDKIFSAERMPPGVAADAWAKAKTDMQTMAYKTLAWIAVARKDNDKSETAIKKTLEKNPNDGEASYWLFQSIRAQKKPERSSEAFWLRRN